MRLKRNRYVHEFDPEPYDGYEDQLDDNSEAPSESESRPSIEQKVESQDDLEDLHWQGQD